MSCFARYITIFTVCAVACLTSLQCCCGFSIDSSACLALLCSASLRDLLPSLLCYPFHTVTLKSVGVSIWSWIGGYLLAFCGIHHHPVSTSSSCWNMSFPPRWLVPVTLFLTMMILKSENILLLEFRYLFWHEWRLFSGFVFYYFACSPLLFGFSLIFLDL